MTKDEALKLALEALVAYGNKHRATYLLSGAWDAEITLGDATITTIKEALAQTQEPVACVQDLDEVKRKHLVYEKGMDWKDPLYTTPPQRTWVGLTDEEIADCAEKMEASDPTDSFWREFFRAIEAKLKEKNT